MDLTARPTMTTKGNTRPGRSAIYDRHVFIAFIAAPSIAVTNNRSHLGMHSSLRFASVSRCVCVYAGHPKHWFQKHTFQFFAALADSLIYWYQTNLFRVFRVDGHAIATTSTTDHCASIFQTHSLVGSTRHDRLPRYGV